MLANDLEDDDRSVDNTERQIREQVFQMELVNIAKQMEGGINPNLRLDQQMAVPILELQRRIQLAELLQTGQRLEELQRRQQLAPQAQQTMDIYNPSTFEQMRNRPLSEEGLFEWQIETIMTSKFERSKNIITDRGKLECSVCLVPFKNGDPLKTLQCLHCYHAGCIDKWLTKRSTCPTCNFNMRSIDFDQLMN